MELCSPCNLFIMLNKMLWLLCSRSRSASAEADRFFNELLRSDWIFKFWICVLISLLTLSCTVIKPRQSWKNSEGIVYDSQTQIRKKKCSHLLPLVCFIIYTCTGIRWVSLCVMSNQGCNICLAGFKDVIPHPHLAHCRQRAASLRHCFRN